MLDSVFIFKPEGVKLIHTFINGPSFSRKEIDKGDVDDFVGIHAVIYEHYYPTSNKLVIDYANTRMLTKYSWLRKDSILQKCRYFQGKAPRFSAFLKYTYTEDSTLTELIKYGGREEFALPAF